MLRRQLQRFDPDGELLRCDGAADLIAAIDAAYHEFDRDRELLERSLDLSSEELVDTNRALQSVVDASPDLYLWIDAMGEVRRIHCEDPEDLAAHYAHDVPIVGDDVRAVRDPAAATRFTHAFDLALRGESTVFEYELPAAGRMRCYEARILPLPTHQFLAIIRNISARKNAEEQRFRQLAEHIDEVLWMIDADTQRTLYVNAAYERTWGRDSASLYQDSSSFVHAIHPEDRPRVESLLPLRARGQYDVEYRIIRPDGELRWIRDRAFPVFDHHGALYRVTGIAADITASKQHQATIEARNEELAIRVRARTSELLVKSVALEQSEQYYQTLFEHSNDTIALIDEQDRIVEVNERALRQFRYRRHELHMREACELFSSNAQEDAAALLSRLTSGNDVRIELECIRSDGTLFWGECSGGRITTETGSVTQLVVHDTSARREAAAALQRSREQLRQAQKMEAVGRLAGGIAHDFNNLLSVIISYSSLIRDAEDLSDSVKEDVDAIMNSAERAANLTQQLLAYSRRQVLQPQLVDLNRILTESQRMLRPLLGEDIDVRLNISDRPTPVLVDPGQMEQIVMNLAVNARDAMPRGGALCIRTSHVVIAEPRACIAGTTGPGTYVTLSVSDTGSGIPAEVLPNICEPFFTTKAASAGTGLGLATVFGIVQQSGGSMEVSTRQDEGTTFTIYLPLASGVLSAPDRIVRTRSPRAHGRILLVEDEEMVRSVAARILEDSGYSVLSASNGIEALNLLGQAEFDLVLTDVVMPRMNGRELGAAVQRLQPAARVLFMTGYTDDAIVRYGVVDGTAELLQKPFTPRELLRRVGEQLSRAPTLMHCDS